MSHSPLLLQLIVILGTARVLALLLRYLGQPAVIGEMLAGIMLGPIVFGALAQELHAALFARESLGALTGLSQLGLVIFMFVVGAEMRMPTGVRTQMIAATRVGVLTVVLPMLLGLAISPMLHPRFAPDGVSYWPFALFMAASMAITAFPVMARILKDTHMTHTPVGQLSLASAAVTDVLAWVILALVVALISLDHGWVGFGRTVIGLVVVVGLAFGVVRPLISRVLQRHASDGKPDGMVLALLLVITFVFAAVTQWLQLHAVFGAFLFGACLPRDDRLLHTLVERLEYMAIVVLMPVFFALAGLNTTPDAFGGTGFGALGLILGAAIIGKIVGGLAGARWSGMDWHSSMAVGSMMNARGLMELIVMKIGLDVGVIGKEIFTMLMVMAILTTVMSTPLLMAFMRGRHPGKHAAGAALGESRQ
ncbi:cation:proton antiporter [Tahibacter amnicola]|uniref:Cation:proton antiporter n=1 Tax=Tahibacter amnicola TaxID=2976241 RepID=A0ABY6BGH9_9GAMM|nr:cation:proton antiporter [Tahibacter amnicola]UXI68701.1 cation:proton antiporter [Tahibacter amnicola]